MEDIFEIDDPFQLMKYSAFRGNIEPDIVKRIIDGEIGYFNGIATQIITESCNLPNCVKEFIKTEKIKGDKDIYWVSIPITGGRCYVSYFNNADKAEMFETMMETEMFLDNICEIFLDTGYIKEYCGDCIPIKKPSSPFCLSKEFDTLIEGINARKEMACRAINKKKKTFYNYCKKREKELTDEYKKIIREFYAQEYRNLKKHS